MLNLKKHGFLFSELVKRDFKKKYKRTYLGMLWSLISPLLTLLVLTLIFKSFFGTRTEHYTIYVFCGNIIFSFFSDATSGAMSALLSNAEVFSKVNVPKYLFLLSKVVSSLINFSLTFGVFIIFCVIDKISFGWNFLALLIPISSLIIFNVGIGLILSALYIFFRDVQYLWGVFTMLLMYLSAIFYTLDGFAPEIRRLFLLNPLYVYIKYFRIVVINGTLPSIQFTALAIAYALLALLVGGVIYKRYNHKFLYYV